MKSKILIGMLLFGSLIKTVAKKPNTNLERDLFEAASKNNGNEVKRLLDERVNVDATNTDDDMTALMIAAQRGNPGIVKILIEANADATLTNNKNKTAFNLAWEIFIFEFNSSDSRNYKNTSYKNTIELLNLYSKIQYRKINLDASSLTVSEYIKEKIKNLSPNDNKPKEELQELAEEAKNNEIDYTYKHFFPAYEKFVKETHITGMPNDPLPLIQFFCDFIAPRSGLLGIMATEIFISPHALYNCLKKLAENSNNINKINILNELLEQTEIIIRMNNQPPIHRLPVRFTTDEPE